MDKESKHEIDLVVFKHIENPQPSTDPQVSICKPEHLLNGPLISPKLNNVLSILENDVDDAEFYKQFESNTLAIIASLIPHIAYHVPSWEALDIVEFTHMMGRLFKRLRGSQELAPITTIKTSDPTLSSQMCRLIYVYRLAAIYDLVPEDFETPTSFFKEVATHLRAPYLAERTCLRETIVICDAAVQCHTRLAQRLSSPLGSSDARYQHLPQGSPSRKKPRLS